MALADERFEDFKISPGVLQKVQNSGFHFQIRVAQDLRSIAGLHSVAEEVGWLNSTTGEGGFFDIVAASHGRRFVIECKVFRKEWLAFLVPSTIPNSDEQQTVAVYSDSRGNSRYVLQGRSRCLPASPVAQYCVAPKDGELIEREASLLVRGTNVLARRLALDRDEELSPRTVMFSMLVTTATLYAVRVNSALFDHSSGVYKAAEEHFMEVPAVRFTKEFTQHASRRAGLRTVWVVNSQRLRPVMQDILGSQLMFSGDGEAE